MNRYCFGPLLTVFLIAGCAGVSEQTTSPGADKAASSGGSPAGAAAHPMTGPGSPHDASDADAAGDTAETATDVWERIRRGYAIPDHDNQRVRRQLADYATYGDYWRRVSQRARPYLYHIVETLESRDMPLELALLPIIESAFRPFAYSHGSAAGIWQFVPATGRHYGLAQNWWYDGRRDVLAATAAAVTYLSYLGEMFEGDWLLATAAYNAGEGTVLRAIERNRQAGRPTDYWSLDLPRETMNYVPRLLAISELVANPSAHGVELEPIPNDPVVIAVDLDRQIDLALAAELANIDMETLYQLNPGYNRWATPPSGPHRLLLPKDHAPRFRQALEGTPETAWMRWQRHRIGRGDTLGGIADEYHTTVASLRDANQLDGDTIRRGDHLLVPIASRPSGEYAMTAGARRQATRDRSRGDGERRRYAVRSGDSLWGIARRFNVGVRELASWNGMAPGDTLKVGEQLVVWTRSRDASSIAASSRLQSVTYSVRQGDSLYRIARQFNVSVGDLRRWNELSPGTYLQPGQELQMKVDVTAQSET
ncbi:LysM peptidoglycan-binding domain-containing protein [Spiribacter vilamensis]|uniref:Membrane-bound lytic murein transglycosylase D n=1 Tax=Spiribacter vilamensis TaxID=531306 RepID=A0A4Q8CYF0_9GAMM|nr:LysM peptidoglycan-binding domain-containing protein [Spiribacter vilamensis]RZU98016.1 membrane-bound lytic murein transglycosylase D [Spiribacter vilamensis]